MFREGTLFSFLWRRRAVAAYPAMLVDDAAAMLAGETFPLRQKKSIHVGLCVDPVLHQIHIIMVLIPCVRAFDSGAWEAGAFEAPSVAFREAALLFRAVLAAFPHLLLRRGAASGAGLLLVQVRAAGHAVHTARGYQPAIDGIGHFHGHSDAPFDSDSDGSIACFGVYWMHQENGKGREKPWRKTYRR